MGRLRRAGALVVVVAVMVVAVEQAAGQSDQPQAPVVQTEETAVGSVEIVADDDTNATVQRIRRNLVLIAVVAAGGLAVFVWHTSPRRRLRIAARRVGASETEIP